MKITETEELHCERQVRVSNIEDNGRAFDITGIAHILNGRLQSLRDGAVRSLSPDITGPDGGDIVATFQDSWINAPHDENTMDIYAAVHGFMTALRSKYNPANE